MRRVVDARQSLLFGTTLILLGAGAAASLWGRSGTATVCWLLATALGLVFATASTAVRLAHRQATVDVIAVLALIGALVVDETFAGAMIAVMLASGQLLEARASARARRELSLLESRAPRTARRRRGDRLEEVPVAAVAVGDAVVVRAGELVPVDGRLLNPAVLDESSLTGEARPVDRPAGGDVRSGVVNAGDPVELLATATSERSTYAGLVRLVEQAQASASPFVRLADRLAVVFVPITLAVSAAAWIVSGDAVRAVAVLVVATPCPLLLAAPIAIMSGISQAARAGVVVKGGAALEQLAGGQVLLFDKTGTLTEGRPQVAQIVPGPHRDVDELQRLAASLDQLSPHPLASALVMEARRRGLTLSTPTNVHEVHGYGIEGEVCGHRVRLGKAGWVAGDPLPAWVISARRRAEIDGAAAVFAAIDGQAAGAFLFSDPVRADAPRTVRSLREAGVRRVVLVTGDRSDTATAVGRFVGADEVVADRDPAAKLAVVIAESKAAPSIMVGDGINDAPSLAAADVGVALAASGATASSEAADVVLTVDRVGVLADAMRIARKARRTALTASLVGMSLSAAAMAVASVGLLAPAAGAIAQEGIDVLAIMIALLALRPPTRPGNRLTGAELAEMADLQRRHQSVATTVDRIAAVADALADRGPDLEPVQLLLIELEEDVLPHERDDDHRLVPLVAKALGSTEAPAALHTAHAEIEQQIERLRRLVAGLDAADLAGEDVTELRRLLYGLHATLRLHNIQERESVSGVADTGPS